MIPRLLHITQIYIRQKNTSKTPYDHNAREPIGKPMTDDAIQLDGQVMWKNQRVYIGSTGVIENTSGYVLFRQKDLTAKNVELQQGDNIVQMGNSEGIMTVNLYINGFDYRGHYADQGGHTLVKAWFKEKQPAAR